MCRKHHASHANRMWSSIDDDLIKARPRGPAFGPCRHLQKTSPEWCFGVWRNSLQSDQTATSFLHTGRCTEKHHACHTNRMWTSIDDDLIKARPIARTATQFAATHSISSAAKPLRSLLLVVSTLSVRRKKSYVSSRIDPCEC